MIQQLLEHLTDDTLILTANKRLARQLHHAYSEYQLSHHQTVWQTLDMLPLQSWMIRWFETLESQGKDIPLLLNQHQTRQLWHSIITESSDGLLHIQSAVELAQEAWSLLKNWNVAVDELHFFPTEDSKTFVEWATQFEKLCRDRHWIDQASIPSFIENYSLENKLRLPEKILLAGFIELPPAVQRLFEKTTLVPIKLPLKSSTLSVMSCQNSTDEIKQMEIWSRDILCRHSNAKIGCIVPHLNSMRQTIDRLFRTTENNISAGWPLSKEPVIDAFFELLRFSHRSISFDDLSFLLRSPYLKGFDVERDARALLEVELRKKNKTTWDTASFRDSTAESATTSSRGLTAGSRINLTMDTAIKSRYDDELDMAIKPRYDDASPHDWVTIFRQLFSAVCYYNEKEKSALERLDNLFHEFETLELVEKQMSFDTAFYTLKQMASKTIFQPTSNSDAPIQILGTLESIDIPFTHVWIMGMDDKTWPSSPKPNPFIPVQLQQQLNMPHCSAKRELEFSEQVSTHWLNQADEIRLSYAQWDNDQNKRLSPLFLNYLDTAVKPRYDVVVDTTIKPRYDDERGRSRYDGETGVAAKPQIENTLLNNTNQTHDIMEFINDSIAPIVSKNETIRGGAAILKTQAQCPFKAFAKFRLNAEKLEPIEEGVTAKTKGTLLHQAMEKIWNTLKTHDQLCSLSDEQLKNLIENTLPNHSDVFFQLENERLTSLIFQWLQLEKKRDPFTVIATEKKQQTTLGDFHLDLRIDRIDQTQRGEIILFDYKTSKTDIKSWFSERMDEPQLPLYATTQHSVNAIAFAQVRSDISAFKGISQRSNILPNDKTIENIKYECSADHWTNQLKQWKEQCEKIIEEFCQGIADISPKNQEICKWCHLKNLCRIFEDKKGLDTDETS